MQLAFSIICYFKSLAKCIEVEFLKVQYNANIWKPFLKYSQLSHDAEKTSIVCNNTPPTIDVAFMDAYGVYYKKGRKRNENKIHLNRKLCREFNNSIKDPDLSRTGFGLVTTATVLHEMVHWGDYISDGIHSPDRDIFDAGTGKILKNRGAGFQFEEEAFNAIYTDK